MTCGRQSLYSVGVALLFGWLVASTLAAGKEHIIWECGQNVPNSAYWKMYSQELEELLPFDGVALRMEYPVTEGGELNINSNKSLGFKLLRKERITSEMTKPFVDNMRAADLKKLKRNLARVTFYTIPPNRMDYFDDAWWEIICNNIRVIAQAARDSGCSGLALDPEQYGGDRCWNYRNLASNTVDKSWGQYVAKVRQRGREFGKALSEGYPDCELLFFFAYKYTLGKMKWSGAKTVEESGDLYWAFLDGMLEGTSDNTIFIEGTESYRYFTAEDFIRARRMVLYDPLAITAVPQLFRKKFRCGFSLWMDNNYDGFTWYPFSPDRNRLTPGILQRTLNLALKYSDGYVWLWNEKANWYVDGPAGKPHPPARQQNKARGMAEVYRQAVREARIWPGLDTSLPVFKIADADTIGYIEDRKLEWLQKRTTKLMDLPKDGWRFKTDWTLAGIPEKWYDPATSTEGWDDFMIGAGHWEFEFNSDDKVDNKYHGFDGVGWYRREIDFKGLPKNKRLYLYFAGVDESCHVWIDGKYVGAYDKGVDGYKYPFAMEVTDFITGGKHTLAIRVHDIWLDGGIYKGISLLAQDLPLTD